MKETAPKTTVSMLRSREGLGFDLDCVDWEGWVVERDVVDGVVEGGVSGVGFERDVFRRVRCFEERVAEGRAAEGAMVEQVGGEQD